MLADEQEDAKRRKQKENARRARRTELRVRLMQLRKMSLEKRMRLFLAPYGVALQVAQQACYMVVIGVVFYIVYTYTPTIKPDPLVELTEKWARPCSQDIGLAPLDQTKINRIDSAFRSVVKEAHRIDRMPWEVRDGGKVEYVYSADRIAALSAFIWEYEWLGPEDRRIVMSKITAYGEKVRHQNTKRQ
jgi:hypothetical protein